MLVVYVKSATRDNPDLEHAKQRIRQELRRELSAREQYLIEFSSVVLDSDEEQDEEVLPKAA